MHEAIKSNRLAVSRESFVVFRTVICMVLVFEIGCCLCAASARDHYLTQKPQKYFIFFNVFLMPFKVLQGRLSKGFRHFWVTSPYWDINDVDDY